MARKPAQKRGLGKKGSIPIISEFLQIFLSVTPKPILLLFFILFISLIAQVIIPVFTTLFGYVCAISPMTNTTHLFQIPVGDAVQSVLFSAANGLNITYLPDTEFYIARDMATTEFVSLQCIETSTPQLYFFAFPVFDARIWIALMVGYALVMFAFLYYNMVGLNR